MHPDTPQVLMYHSQFCGFCAAALRLLEQLEAEVTLINVDGQSDLRAEMKEKAGGVNTVPQIWIHGHYVGGNDQLQALHAKGELVPLLQKGEGAGA